MNPQIQNKIFYVEPFKIVRYETDRRNITEAA